MMLPIAIMTVLKEIFHLNSPLGVIYKLKVSSHVKQSVYNFIRKETLAQVFSYEFAKFQHLFLQNTSAGCFCLMWTPFVFEWSFIFVAWFLTFTFF